MRKLLVCLGLVALALVPAQAIASPTVLKPYVVMILDTSGSMADPVIPATTPTCGGSVSKLDNARCAINEIANSEGDIVFGLGRYRETMAGTTTAATFPSNCTQTGLAQCPNACDSGTGTGCQGSGSGDSMFELLTPLVDGQNAAAAAWTNFTGNTCTATGTDPEIWETEGSTPLAGTLKGVKDYWIGQAVASDATADTIWPSTSVGFAPIANDPTNASFLPASGCNSAATCNPAAACSGATCCCVSQCRPYVVILLTDGQETCTKFTNTVNAAASLLTTDVGGKAYRVETKVIGFGLTPPSAATDCSVVGTGTDGDPCVIEAIAHAGGSPDVMGVNEGFYAANQSDVELAITSILAGAIRTEVCNGLDDNCNGQVDEGFNVGSACTNGELGVCLRTSTTACTADGTGTVCQAPTVPIPPQSAEICGNGLDDDCDGKIDEGCGTSCTPEVCDGKDNNCNGLVDEGLTIPCGVNVGACKAGVEQCVDTTVGGVTTGAYDPTTCTATQGTPEKCNGIDDDCDGIVDGFSQACSTMPPINGNPAGSAANNPGDPGQGTTCDTEGPAICVCHPGSQLCASNQTPPYMFGACLNEVKPSATEVCNGLDDDCDGKVDEGTGGAPCNASCGVGVTKCVNGELTCTAVGGAMPEICNGIDDDCDGRVDEDLPAGGSCNPPTPNNNYTVCNGTLTCVETGPGSATEECEGGTVVAPEQCNCLDDDCDGSVDEGSDICGGGATCTDCQCAFPCGGGEFPCPNGKMCTAGFCVVDPCFNVSCSTVGGNLQVCQAGTCVDACSITTCMSPLVCVPDSGLCEPNDCTTFPAMCTADQNCVAGVCTSNPCQGVNCTAPQYCESGTCVTSCAGITCPTDQTCTLGVCTPNACGSGCPPGEACNTASMQCTGDPCLGKVCPTGEYCDSTDDGNCKIDPCVGTMCPDPSQICKAGTCSAPPMVSADGGVQINVTTGGGGCDVGGGGGAGGGVLIALAGVLAARRRRVGGAS